jgi:hypothetical protein
MSPSGVTMKYTTAPAQSMTDAATIAACLFIGSVAGGRCASDMSSCETAASCCQPVAVGEKLPAEGPSWSWLTATRPKLPSVVSSRLPVS